MKKIEFIRIVRADGSIEERWSMPIPQKKIKKGTLTTLLERFMHSISNHGGGGSPPPMLPSP